MAKKLIKTFDFLQEIEGEFEDTLIETSTDQVEPIQSISTGATSLDVALGVGGIPLRRFTEINGVESSGKTTLGLSIAKQAILSGRRVLYNDPEQGLDMDRAVEIIGEEANDKSKFILVQPELMEQSLRICEMAIQDSTFGLIVLDSIASMTPKKVKEDDLGDANVALLARTFGNFLNRNAYDLRHKDIAFVGINQVRDKFGAYRPTLETPGGHNWKHKLSIQIQLSKSEVIKKGADSIGILVKFVIKKNKVAPPMRTSFFPIMFDHGIDFYMDLVDFAETIGVLRVGGAYYKFEDIVLASGKVKTMEYLKENPAALDKIVKACYSMTGQTVAVKEEVEDEQEFEV